MRTPRHEDLIADELLVLEAQSGDRAALDRLVARWSGAMGRLARRLTGDDEMAREAVQDAWIGVVRGLGRLDDPARFGGWAMRIVRRRCADRIRARGRARDASSSVAPAVGRDTSTPVSAEHADSLREALASLDPDDRLALGLHYVDGLALRHVASALGVPVGTVKSRLHAARARLREALSALEDTERSTR